jgi:hypothetical protein
MSLESLKVQIIKKAWEDSTFKKSLTADPKKTIMEAFGVEIPGEIEVKVVEETPSLYYLTIPPNPEDMAIAESSTNAAW